ncbi:hypothetical protein J6590_105560 [Homalodisca vitripennis]|nr:hypothetical protein J6590_105560 [Homalodisca vitripennis]
MPMSCVAFGCFNKKEKLNFQPEDCSFRINFSEFGLFDKASINEEGVATAGALVSVANQNSPDVVDEVQSCKESLASVGFTGHLVNVVKCSA